MASRLALLFATWFGSGLLKPAPGTWGSLAALPFAYVLIEFIGAYALIPASVLVFGLGLWASAIYSRDSGKQDASEIVIDEVVGQWISLLPWAFLMPQWLWGYVIAFGLFRLFDILKPWPVRLADERHDAWGVMLDDCIAGALAALLSWGIIIYAL